MPEHADIFQSINIWGNSATTGDKCAKRCSKSDVQTNTFPREKTPQPQLHIPNDKLVFKGGFERTSPLGPSPAFSTLLQRLLGSCTPFPRCRQPFSPCLWLCSPGTSSPRPGGSIPSRCTVATQSPFTPAQLPEAPGPRHALLGAKPVPHTLSWCETCCWYPPEHHF